jgi:nucleotide-binding universal stress UspA family protein
MTRVSHEPMPGIRNVLFATDFTQTSYPALQFAASVTRNLETKLIVFHVIQPDTLRFASPEALGNYFVDLDANATRQMSEISAMLADTQHECVIRHGYIAEELSSVVREEEVGLIVVGTGLVNGATRLLLGSMAEGIAREVPCPVLIVGAHAAAPKSEVFRSVLVASDLGGYEASAAALARTLSGKDASISVLYVIDQRQHIPDRVRVLKQIRRQMEALLPSGDAAANARVVIEFGRPAEQIVEQARRDHADLIVMGLQNTEHPHWATHFTTVLHDVLTQVSCPVLAIPRKVARVSRQPEEEMGVVAQ